MQPLIVLLKRSSEYAQNHQLTQRDGLSKRLQSAGKPIAERYKTNRITQKKQNKLGFQHY